MTVMTVPVFYRYVSCTYPMTVINRHSSAPLLSFIVTPSPSALLRGPAGIDQPIINGRPQARLDQLARLIGHRQLARQGAVQLARMALLFDVLKARVPG